MNIHVTHATNMRNVRNEHYAYEGEPQSKIF